MSSNREPFTDGVDDVPDLVDAAEQFRQELLVLVEEGPEAVEEDAFQAQAGQLADAIHAADAELANDIGTVDAVASRASGKAGETLTEFFQTTVQATTTRSWLVTVLEGYEMLGVDLGVHHDRVYDLLEQFAVIEHSLPEQRSAGRDAIDTIESRISEQKSPFVEGGDRTRGVERTAQQFSTDTPATDDISLELLGVPSELLPVGSVLVLPVRFRTRQTDTTVDGTLSVSMADPLYGGFVDLNPDSEPPVDPALEDDLRTAVTDNPPDENVGIAMTDAERAVSASADHQFVALAVYIADVGVEDIGVSLTPDMRRAATAETQAKLEGQTEEFIEARADALDESTPWVAVGGGIAGVAAGGYLLYNKYGSGDETGGV